MNDTAVAGEDYTAISGTLTFNPGETQASISLAAIEDDLDEDDKDLNIVLSNPVNAELSKSSITVSIFDNDEAQLFLLEAQSLMRLTMRCLHLH